MTLRVCPAGTHIWHILECTIWWFLLVYGLGKVFTLTFFHWCISLWVVIKIEKGIVLMFPIKRHNLLHFRAILGDIKYFYHFINFWFDSFYLDYIGKGGAFHGLLFSHNWEMAVSYTEISKWTVGDGRQKKINLISMKNTLFQRVTVCICLVFLTLSTPFLLQQLHHNSFL